MAKTGERKAQILQTLAAMLEEPKAERITTALLAARLEVSEAALYRHFSSKAQMFEGLIEFIEQTVFSLVNRIQAEEPDALKQVEAGRAVEHGAEGRAASAPTPRASAPSIPRARPRSPPAA